MQLKKILIEVFLLNKSKILYFWEQAISIGIIPNLTDEEIKKIRLTNGICIITGTVGVVVSIVSMSADLITTKRFSVTLIPGIIAITAGFIAWACSLLNYFHKYRFARYSLFILWWITFTSFGIVFGEDIRIDQYLITIFVLPLIFFDWRLEIYFFSLVTVFLFAVAQISYTFMSPVIVTPQEFAPYRYAIHTAFMLASLFAVVLYFKYQNEENEKKIKAEINERKKAEAKLKKMAYHDPLTGLMNRKSFEEKLENNLNQSGRKEDDLWALMYLDLDKFKQINDTLGHEIGDEVLKNAAYRISSCIRKTDFLFRIGGDEFTIILNNLKSRESAFNMSLKIKKAINAPVTIQKNTIDYGVSIGISIYPDDGREPGTLIKNADIAMYTDKDASRK